MENDPKVRAVFIDQDPVWGWGDAPETVPPPELDHLRDKILDTSTKTANHIFEFLLVLTIATVGALLLRQFHKAPVLEPQIYHQQR